MKEIKIECTKCDLHKWRTNIVVGRGSVPADILFIGEAPGMTENLRGIPFIGTEEKLLTKMLNEVIKYSEGKLKKIPSYYLTNTILCRPCEDKLSQTREPSISEVLQCQKNLSKIIKQIKPIMVVFVGKIAETYFKNEFPDGVTILHPSFLVKQGGNKSPYYLTTIRILQQVFEKVASNG